MSDPIIPVISTAILQEKATEFAMKGAIETIKEFYSGYNSPFRKQIEAQLQEFRIGTVIELPDIIGLINESLTSEIDLIANTAVAKSFVPLVQGFLTRESKEINFSDFLKNFISYTDDYDSNTEEDYSVLISPSQHGWLNIEISSKDRKYKLTFHGDYSTKGSEIKKYQLLSLPFTYDEPSHRRQQMKISIDGVTLEMPFTPDVLKDNFVSYVGRLIIANSKITMDCDDFNSEMFPEEECHCR